MDGSSEKNTNIIYSAETFSPFLLFMSKIMWTLPSVCDGSA